MRRIAFEDGGWPEALVSYSVSFFSILRRTSRDEQINKLDSLSKSGIYDVARLTREGLSKG